MRTFVFIATTLTVGISMVACSGNNASSKESGTKQASSQQSAPKQAVASTPPASKPAVQNEVVFDVPEMYQKEMQLQSEALKDNGSGAIAVPKASIQTINNRPSVFMSLGNNQFALRHITVAQETETHALVRENMVSGEMVVTVGAAELTAGLMRMMSGHNHDHHGHSHDDM